MTSGAETLRHFLPDVISRYRSEYNAVTFDVSRRHGEAAETALASLETDLALIFEPIRGGDFQTIATARQAVYCCMAETHDLARLETIRLHHLINIPVILPTNQSGVRQLLNVGLIRRNINLSAMLETDSQEFTQNYIHNEQVVGFQIPIGLPNGMADRRSVDGIIARPIDSQDVSKVHYTSDICVGGFCLLLLLNLWIS